MGRKKKVEEKLGIRIELGSHLVTKRWDFSKQDAETESSSGECQS